MDTIREALRHFVLLQAKEYVARHEGALQERFAMSRSTKDLWARFKILLAAVNAVSQYLQYIPCTVQGLL